MTVAVALWSVAVSPGKRVTVVPQADLRIVNVALSHELADASGRTSVTVTYDMLSKADEDGEDDDDDAPSTTTTVLCSLTPGKIEQATVDLILDEDQEFVIEVLGENTVYLTGNYIDQHPQDFLFDDESDEDEEEAFDLREVSSDVEMDPDELGSDDEGRFEEIIEAEVAKSLKRSSGAMEEKKAPDVEQNKRLKGENGKVVTAGAETKGNEQEKKDKKKKKKKEKKGKEGKEAEADKEQSAKKDTAAAATTDTNTTPQRVIKEITGGVKLVDAKLGTGPQAKKGNTVSMRYIGKLENGKIFDKNTKGKPFTFQLGNGDVIKGWDEGIAGMQVGGERVLTIPPNMGYGKKKSTDIPPNSTLTFDCKLLEIK